jgi:hypothetical protein
MKIVKIDLESLDFDCPVTGEYILKEDEPINEDAKTLMAYWLDMTFEEPFIKNEKLRVSWQTFTEKYIHENDGYEPDFDAFEAFIGSLNWDNWICYKLVINGMACGPTSSTVWKILDLGIDSSDENE